MEPAPTIDDRRKVGFWLGLCASMIIALGVIAGVLWRWLPIWAPEFVIRHSPWVEPVLRAEVGRGSPGAKSFSDRMSSWGSGAVPGLLWAFAHCDPQVRNLALSCLLIVADERCIDALIRALDEPNIEARRAVARSLGELGDPRAIPPLLDQLPRRTSEDYPSLFAALIALHVDAGQRPRLLEAGIRALQEWDYEMRGEVAVCLGELGDLRAVQPVLDAIQEMPGMPGARFRLEPIAQAIRGLDMLGDPRASLAIMRFNGGFPAQDIPAEPQGGGKIWAWYPNPIAVPLLTCLLLLDEDSGRRDFAVRLLARQAGVSASAALIHALGDDSDHVRQDALSALETRALTPDQSARAVAILIGGLSHSDAERRRFAATASAVFHDSRSAPSLIRAMADPVIGVRLAAIEASAASDDLRVVDPLADQLVDPDRRVVHACLLALGSLTLDQRQRAAAVDRMLAMFADADESENAFAVRAAGVIRDPRLVPVLMDGLEAAPVLLSRAIIATIGFQHDARAVDLLITIARDPDSDLRWEAIAALAAIGDPRAIPVLIVILGDRDDDLHTAANTALTRFNLSGDQRRVVAAASAKRKKNR